MLCMAYVSLVVNVKFLPAYCCIRAVAFVKYFGMYVKRSASPRYPMISSLSLVQLS